MRHGFLRLLVVLAISLTAASPLCAGIGPVPPGIDLWRTPGDGTTFSDFAESPIPAGFFCSGSQPFSGRIVFEGVPVATDKQGILGATDTIVQRLDEARFNAHGVAVTRIQVKALSLAGVAPIRTECGLYSVMVKLHGEQPVTQMRIVRTGAEGGFFVAPLALRAKLTFTPVAGHARKTRELIQRVEFDRTPRIPWVDQATERRRPAPVKVDTDGDLEPDTVLPGPAPFVANGRQGPQAKLFVAPKCHCDPSKSFLTGPGTYVTSGELPTGCTHLHCPTVGLPADGPE